MNEHRLQWLQSEAEETLRAGDRTGAIAKAHALNVLELIAEVRRLNELLAVAKLMLAARGQRWPDDPFPVIEIEDDGTAASE